MFYCGNNLLGYSTGLVEVWVSEKRLSVLKCGLGSTLNEQVEPGAIQ